MGVNIYSEIGFMNIEYISGSSSHSSNWAKFYIFGLDKWAVRETDGEPTSNNHANFKQFTCLDVSENKVFTVFEQDGDKRGTDTFNFYICKASAEFGEIKGAYGRHCTGNFEIICEGIGKTKAPRLMGWWEEFAGKDDANKRKNSEKIAFANHCLGNIDRRGIKTLPPFEIAQPEAVAEVAEVAIATEIPPVAEQLELVSELPQVDRREWIDPNLINLESGTQTRRQSPEKIADYAEMMRSGEWDWTRSDIVIYENESGAYPSDGHHRIEAAIIAEVQIFAEVKKGTLRDAIFESFASNKFHGLPLSREDKNNRVKAILLDDEWQLMSDRAIADHCGVSAPLVGKVRSELVAESAIAPTVQRKGKDGRSQASKKSGTKSGSNSGTKSEKSKSVLVENNPVDNSLLEQKIPTVETPVPEQTTSIPEFIAPDIKNPVAIAIDPDKARQDAIVKHLSNQDCDRVEGLETAKRIADTLTFEQLLELQAYITELCPEF